MDLTAWLYGLWVFATAADALASLLAAFYLFRLRQRFSLYMAMALLGAAIEALSASLTMALFPTARVISLWLIIWRLLGRAFKAATMAMLTLYLLGYVDTPATKIRRGGAVEEIKRAINLLIDAGYEPSPPATADLCEMITAAIQAERQKAARIDELLREIAQLRAGQSNGI